MKLTADGSPCTTFALTDPSDRSALERVLAGQATGFTTIRLTTRGQSWRWFELSTTTVRGADQAVVAVEGTARDVTERRAADEERLHLLAEVEMQLDRNRIAGDLHDDTVQSIYAIGLGLHAMRDDASLDREHVVDRTVESLNEVIASLRSYMHRLSGATDHAEEREPLASRIGSLTPAAGDTRWTVDIDEHLELNPAIEQQLYLLAKELISNVIRDAGTDAASLTLRADAQGDLVLTVADDGVGFERESVGAGSFGLRSVALRADTLGAAFALTSAPGTGTEVRVCVPAAALAAAPAADDGSRA